MFTKPNSASANFMLSATAWLVLGVLMGLLLALELVFPDIARGVPWLVFGRMRQAHTSTVMFAFLSAGMMGIWLYIVPRLTGRQLWSEVLGNVCVALWNAALLVGVAALLDGYTQSREYAELIWGVDVAVMAVLILNMVNIYMTVSHRTEPKFYVSMWYIIGSVIWMPMLYFIGNVMWNPPTGALTGINDSIIGWFYGHNVLGLWFTTGLLPVVYYIVPKETNTPLYSHVLSLFAFWGIAFFYTGVGAHHLLWAPIPYWLKTIAIADSIGMLLPVIAFMMNIYLTMRGNWNRFFSSVSLRFVLTGWFAYILTSFQGTHQAFRAVNELTHFTQYVPAHSHLGLLFFAGSVVMGGIYYTLPRIYDCRLYSRTLANIQYSLYLFGFAAFFSGFVLTGLVQGTAWVNQGLPVWSVLPGLRPYMALRAVGGAVIVISVIIFAFNVFATALRRVAVNAPPKPHLLSAQVVSPSS